MDIMPPGMGPPEDIIVLEEDEEELDLKLEIVDPSGTGSLQQCSGCWPSRLSSLQCRHVRLALGLHGLRYLGALGGMEYSGSGDSQNSFAGICAGQLFSNYSCGHLKLPRELP